ncbi:Crp/Fnr family transcriptional regulator [Streptomyces sp. HM190]|uniref:Crp/Fnr family transcriptional regulator n=1 Tax=Streptomyces sp. HM190 TaxID=2695266 RepID=UPI00135C6C65|nr:Crp/Fnr family transcriptional regulator [Streptomyces sp. HM190]
MEHETFWSTLDAREREALQTAGRVPKEPYLPGDQLLRQDEEADRAALIITGRCRVLWQGEAGRTTYLATRRDGDLIGEMALLDGGRRNATVRALTKTYVRWYSREVFEGLLTRHRDIMRKLLRSANTRLKESDHQQIALTSAPPQVRLARLLLRLAEAEGTTEEQGTEIRDVSRQDLGDWTGMGRDAAGRAITRLRDLGLICPSRARRRIVITDLDGLRRHAFAPPDD